jgi:hypothetical protein
MGPNKKLVGRFATQLSASEHTSPLAGIRDDLRVGRKQKESLNWLGSSLGSEPASFRARRHLSQRRYCSVQWELPGRNSALNAGQIGFYQPYELPNPAQAPAHVLGTKRRKRWPSQRRQFLTLQPSKNLSLAKVEGNAYPGNVLHFGLERCRCLGLLLSADRIARQGTKKLVYHIVYVTWARSQRQ